MCVGAIATVVLVVVVAVVTEAVVIVAVVVVVAVIGDVVFLVRLDVIVIAVVEEFPGFAHTLSQGLQHVRWLLVDDLTTQDHVKETSRGDARHLRGITPEQRQNGHCSGTVGTTSCDGASDVAHEQR